MNPSGRLSSASGGGGGGGGIRSSSSHFFRPTTDEERVARIPATRLDHLVAVLKDVDPGRVIDASHILGRERKQHIHDTQLYFMLSLRYQESESTLLASMHSFYVMLDTWMDWITLVRTAFQAQRQRVRAAGPGNGAAASARRRDTEAVAKENRHDDADETAAPSSSTRRQGTARGAGMCRGGCGEVYARSIPPDRCVCRGSSSYSRWFTCSGEEEEEEEEEKERESGSMDWTTRVVSLPQPVAHPRANRSTDAAWHRGHAHHTNDNKNHERSRSTGPERAQSGNLTHDGVGTEDKENAGGCGGESAKPIRRHSRSPPHGLVGGTANTPPMDVGKSSRRTPSPAWHPSSLSWQRASDARTTAPTRGAGSATTGSCRRSGDGAPVHASSAPSTPRGSLCDDGGTNHAGTTTRATTTTAAAAAAAAAAAHEYTTEGTGAHTRTHSCDEAASSASASVRTAPDECTLHDMLQRDAEWVTGGVLDFLTDGHLLLALVTEALSYAEGGGGAEESKSSTGRAEAPEECGTTSDDADGDERDEEWGRDAGERARAALGAASAADGLPDESPGQTPHHRRDTRMGRNRRRLSRVASTESVMHDTPVCAAPATNRSGACTTCLGAGAFWPHTGCSIRAVAATTAAAGDSPPDAAAAAAAAGHSIQTSAAAAAGSTTGTTSAVYATRAVALPIAPAGAWVSPRSSRLHPTTTAESACCPVCLRQLNALCVRHLGWSEAMMSFVALSQGSSSPCAAAASSASLSLSASLSSVAEERVLGSGSPCATGGHSPALGAPALLRRLHGLALALWQRVRNDRILPPPPCVSFLAHAVDPAESCRAEVERDEIAMQMALERSCLPFHSHLSVTLQSNSVMEVGYASGHEKVDAQKEEEEEEEEGEGGANGSAAMRFDCTTRYGEAYVYDREHRLFRPMWHVLRHYMMAWEGIGWYMDMSRVNRCTEKALLCPYRRSTASPHRRLGGTRTDSAAVRRGGGGVCQASSAKGIGGTREANTTRNTNATTTEHHDDTTTTTTSTSTPHARHDTKSHTTHDDTCALSHTRAMRSRCHGYPSRRNDTTNQLDGDGMSRSRGAMLTASSPASRPCVPSATANSTTFELIVHRRGCAHASCSDEEVPVSSLRDVTSIHVDGMNLDDDEEEEEEEEEEEMPRRVGHTGYAGMVDTMPPHFTPCSTRDRHDTMACGEGATDASRLDIRAQGGDAASHWRQEPAPERSPPPPHAAPEHRRRPPRPANTSGRERAACDTKEEERRGGGYVKSPLSPLESVDAGRINFSATIVHESQQEGIALRDHRFRVSGQPVGVGAFGAVYRALDLETGIIVAVKQSRYSVDHNRVSLSWRELRTWSMLPSHTNVITFHGASHEAETQQLLLVLEYASGGSISNLYREYGPIPERIFRRHAREMAQGLQHLHNHNVVHGDVKPENVLTRSDGSVAISDFGCSRLPFCPPASRTAAAAADRSHVGGASCRRRDRCANRHALASANAAACGLCDTVDAHAGDLDGECATRQICGTVAYMAPEVINSASMLKSDVWAYACSLLQLYLNILPWTTTANIQDTHEPLALMYFIATQEAAIPYSEEQIYSAPRWLQKIACRAFKRDLASRCTMGEVLSILTEYND